MKPLVIAAALALAALAPLAVAADDAPSAVAAAGLVRDITMDFFDGKTHHYEYFAADGTSTHVSKGTVVKGRWYARDDGTVCFIHPDPNQSGCVHVLRDDAMIEFHLISGDVEGPFPYAPGNPQGL